MGYPIYSRDVNDFSRSRSGECLWMLVCVPADQCESGNCRWLNLEPYINLARKTKDGRLYEVVIQTWSLKWLFFLECDTNLNCNPTAPTKEDILILGFKKATVIAHAGFLSNAVNEIRSRRCQGYKECCRHYARSNGLAITFERILLIHDIVESDPSVRKRIAQCLLFLGLILLEDYSSYDAFELLRKDQTALLQAFWKCYMDPFKTLSEPKPTMTLHRRERQIIFLLRHLLKLSSGKVDYQQHAFKQGFTSNDNVSLYGALVGVAGKNPFGDFDTKQMQDALLKSKNFDVGDITILNTVEWSRIIDRRE